MKTAGEPSKRLRINFLLPPIPKISGGPLAILEYGNRLIERGHEVTITTYPDIFWTGDDPFPWMKFNGKVHYAKMRSGVFQNTRFAKLLVIGKLCWRVLFRGKGGSRKETLAMVGMLMLSAPFIKNLPWRGEKLNIGIREFCAALFRLAMMTQSIPDCDLNIATWWMTAFPALWSGKGRPVYFIQHYEEIFYDQSFDNLMNRLMCRMTYELPIYKVANSSWLTQVIEDKFGEKIPWSSNGIDLKDFSRAPKLSEKDGVIRIITYSRPEEWKGLGDAATVITEVRQRTNAQIEWHLFGYKNPKVAPENPDCPYIYHEKLSFRELSKLYAQSDINLFCSWYESFPLPPLEAMACGTAVVTSALGTEEYALHEQTALVFAARKLDDAVNHVVRLIEDPQLRRRLAEAGFKKAQEFSWDVAVERREKILLDIDSGKSHEDRFLASDTGFIDGNGIRFSQMPKDLERFDAKLIQLSDSEEIFLTQKGIKRAILKPALVPTLRENYGAPMPVSLNEFHRIPSGYPIREINHI